MILWYCKSDVETSNLTFIEYIVVHWMQGWRGNYPFIWFDVCNSGKEHLWGSQNSLSQWHRWLVAGYGPDMVKPHIFVIPSPRCCLHFQISLSFRHKWIIQTPFHHNKCLSFIILPGSNMKVIKLQTDISMNVPTYFVFRYTWQMPW